MSYHIYDYQKSFGFTSDLNIAKHSQKTIHAQNMDKFTEIHETGHGGIDQLEPDDCWNCRKNIHRCECQGLGYSLSVCLGNCSINPQIKNQCSNTHCALNPWFQGEIQTSTDKIENGILIDYKTGNNNNTKKQLKFYKQILEARGLKISKTMIYFINSNTIKEVK